MRRRWIFWLLVIVFLWVLVSRFTEIEKLAQTLASGQWQWVLGAALLQVVYYIFYTGIYQSAFDTVGVDSRLGELLPVTFASIFINVAAPSGGASGAALFVDDAARRGQPAGRAAVGTLLVLVADFSAILLVLLAGMLYLFSQHDLRTYELLGALVLLALVGGLTGLLLLGLWRAEWLLSLLSRLQAAGNRIAARLKQPPFLADGWAKKTAAEFSEAAIAIAAHPALLGRTLLLALAAHLFNLASLYCLFLAFHQPVGPGLLVAGYAMGILFWIVSLTPQGIGVVEGVMTLVFTSLGVPAERAAIIALSFRGLTFWLPLATGFLLLRRVKTFQRAERLEGERLGVERLGVEPIHSERLGVRLVAVLTGLMGLVNLLSGLTPSLAGRLRLLERYSPLSVVRGGHVTAALAGFALLLLSTSLWRRKRLAWLLTEMVLVISIFSHLYKGLDYEEALISAALAGWLFYLRPHFHARSDPPSVRQGLFTLAAAFIFTLLYGTLGFYLLDRHFQVNFGAWDALAQTVVMFTQFYDPGLQPLTGFGRYFAGSIYTVGVATFGYALFMLVRPVLAQHGASPEEREQATQIVQTWGRSALARLALLDDKLYFFSPGGSLAAYVVKGRTALVLGDPVGPPEDFAACLAAFEAFCARNDWRPAYYQVLPERLETYKSAGYSLLCVGEEGIVDLSTFTLAGGENKNFRTAVNRLTRLNYRAEVLLPPHPPELLETLREISDEWLTHMHGSEKRFSLGWFDEAYLNAGPLMVIRRPEGEISAFANILLVQAANQASIDLMRHRQSGEKGQMDFLFAALFQWARENGCTTFDLGLSALSGMGENPQDPAIERALHYVYEHIEQFYNFKGLHEFKEKYHPAWSPRYLVYPGTASLPGVVIAMLRADSGDDLLGGYLRRG